MKRAIAFALGAIGLVGCNVEKTSIAENSIAGQYYQAWSENGQAVELIINIESPDPAQLSGTYVVVHGETTARGTVTGTLTDSVRLTFKADFLTGDFVGVEVDHHALDGHLRLNDAVNHLDRIGVLQKRKYQF
jgi:hypothetical protein